MLIHSTYAHSDLSLLVVVVLLAEGLLVPITAVWISLYFRILICSKELRFSLVRLSKNDAG